MKKEKLVCDSCGSENFVRDAFAKWDFENQEFDLHSSYDDGKCLDCEEDGRGSWIDVEVRFAVELGRFGNQTGEIQEERYETYEQAEEAASKLRDHHDWWASVKELSEEDTILPGSNPTSSEILHSELNKDRNGKEENPQ